MAQELFNKVTLEQMNGWKKEKEKSVFKKFICNYIVITTVYVFIRLQLNTS